MVPWEVPDVTVADFRGILRLDTTENHPVFGDGPHASVSLVHGQNPQCEGRGQNLRRVLFKQYQYKNLCKSHGLTWYICVRLILEFQSSRHLFSIYVNDLR